MSANNEWNGHWKWAGQNPRHYSGIYLEALRKAMNPIPNQDNQPQDQNP